MEAALYDVGKIDNIACGFGEIAACKLDVSAVQPEARKGTLTDSAFRLCNFVVVMDGNVLDAAGVDIYLLAEGLPNHCRALDMPAGESASPRALPTDCVS